MSSPPRRTEDLLNVRAVLRVVLVVVVVVLTLVLMYLLRRPLTWIFIAAFIAVALSGPINLLERRMRRGFAVAIVYIALILTPVRADRAARPADRHAGRQPHPERAGVRPAGDGLRQRERPAATAPGRVRHHRPARGGGRQAPEPGRRRRGRAERHRRRPGELDLRRGHDPRALDLHAGQRQAVPRRVGAAVPARSRGVDAQPLPTDRQRDRQLRRRRAPSGHGRRLHELDHAADPRRRLRAAARGDRLHPRPHPARGRHARRPDRRHRDALLRLPDRHRDLDRSTRSSTSRWRTTSSSRASRPARSSSTR